MQTTPSGQDDLSLKVKVRSTPLKIRKIQSPWVKLLDKSYFNYNFREFEDIQIL